ncbi:MAG: ribonuclease HII [Clostridia bacterium]|nr:ribonuclease HII [Clostridia bacterium]
MKEKELERLSSMVEFEKAFYDRGYKVIAGVDEAGRGPLAGDVYAAAVIFRPGTIIEGLNDSKKISPKKRDMLFDEIKEKAVSYAVGVATVAEIEELDILNATFLAMRRAIESLSVKPDFVMVDGNQHIRKLEIENEPVIKGDSLSMSIAAASILAKVSRDRYMEKMAKKYPEYEFEGHKGYGTKRHSELIKEFGPCPIHRLSFLKNILK